MAHGMDTGGDGAPRETDVGTSTAKPGMPHGGLSRIEMEARRLEAERMLADGCSQSEVSRCLGVSRTSTCRWARMIKMGRSLVRSTAPGRPSRVTTEQHRRLVDAYHAGPEKWGYKKWTTWNFARVVLTLTGIRYDADHVGRLMRQ